MDVVFRLLDIRDVEHVKWALYEAVAWNPERVLPPFGLAIEHPELARYHAGWGRPGDLGVVAESWGDVVGVALCRLFTEADYGHGYVDDETPELAVAVAEWRRGVGVGTSLMHELVDAAREAGFTRLSLSVDEDNPALRLYERLGYRELSRDGTASVCSSTSDARPPCRPRREIGTDWHPRSRLSSPPVDVGPGMAGHTGQAAASTLSRSYAITSARMSSSVRVGAHPIAAPIFSIDGSRWRTSSMPRP